ncbi:MAG: hypothetical protein HFI37_09455 [Lachnospiraceae bacterium]|nr:hypothetical protein [Lachnospiraceae bacterium]
MMFDDFDNTDFYKEFIEELLEANREGKFDEVFNRAYSMEVFSIDELIDIYTLVDDDCVQNFCSKNVSTEAKELDALRLEILRSLSEANTSSVAFELAACFFDHFSKGADAMDRGAFVEESMTRIFKCIASTGSWSEFFAGVEPVFHIYYPQFSDRIHFDCSRLAGMTCNLERGKQIIALENCHPSFREAFSNRKDFSKMA